MPLFIPPGTIDRDFLKEGENPIEYSRRVLSNGKRRKFIFKIFNPNDRENKWIQIIPRALIPEVQNILRAKFLGQSSI